MPIMLNDLTLQGYENLFTLSKADLMPYEWKDNVWVSVTVEADLDLTFIERKVYTLFASLSDIGGLS